MNIEFVMHALFGSYTLMYPFYIKKISTENQDKLAFSRTLREIVQRIKVSLNSTESNGGKN